MAKVAPAAKAATATPANTATVTATATRVAAKPVPATSLIPRRALGKTDAELMIGDMPIHERQAVVERLLERWITELSRPKDPR